MVDYDKPMTLTLLALILLLTAFITITAAMYAFFYTDEFWNHGLLKGIGAESNRLFMVLIFSVLLLMSGIGLLKSASLGRWLFVLVNILMIIHGIMMVISGISRGYILLIVCVILIFYMFTRRVSDVFRPIDSQKAVSAINALESYRRRGF